MSSSGPSTANDLPAIVLATRLGQNAEAMRRVLISEGLDCQDAASIEAVIEAIQRDAALIILTEDVLTSDRNVKLLIDCLNEQPEWSDVPILFLLKDYHRFPTYITFLRNAQHQRSITLLEMPLKRHEFVSVVQSCLLDRQRQYKLRDTLQQLNDSNQALESFSHTVAHELRNPLTVVTGSFEMLNKSSLVGYEERIARLGLKTSRKMNETLTTLLEYGKLSARRTVVFDWVDMNQVVEQAVEGLQNIIKAHQAHVDWLHLPTVFGNDELLNRLVSNLIKNAIVHNGASSPVVMISCQARPGGDRFEFTDNGPGIAKEDQQEIFAMFGRVGERRTEGSGIGLALCQRIVHQHQGTLGVESTPGQGSTFYFELPKVPQGSDRHPTPR